MKNDIEIKTLIRPRLIDFHGLDLVQEKTDFAIPFINEDLPLYVDPFLMWKSPSQQDQSLHLALMNSFKSILTTGNTSEVVSKIQMISECDEVGLGGSSTRRGHRIGQALAKNIMDNFLYIKNQFGREIRHLEEIQLITDQISKDRISDFTCSILKSFLVDFTIDQSIRHKIPLTSTTLKSVFDSRDGLFKDLSVELPVNPVTKEPILLVPKRWLRYTPWINYEDYFENHYLKGYVEEGKPPPSRFEVLNYNRDHYDVISQYLEKKEKSFADCKNDPLFQSIPILSAKRAFATIQRLPSGKTDNADRKFEDSICKLLPSLFYPHLDFAEEQSRTDSGVLIRDLIFYNNRSTGILSDFWDQYSSRQIVFELKNVSKLERDHVNQLNRYLKDSFGSVGIFVTRNAPPTNIQKSLVDLWSGQRKCILVLTDQDLEMMVDVFESKQRDPIEIINKKHVEFMRSCPG